MKKTAALILIVLALTSLCSCDISTEEATDIVLVGVEEYAFTAQCKTFLEEYCEKRGLSFSYVYTEDTDVSVKLKIDKAENENIGLLILCGTTGTESFAKTAQEYPNTTFLWVGEKAPERKLPDNAGYILYSDVIEGFICGCACRFSGVIDAGFMGMNTQDDMNLGMGFVQGFQYASETLGENGTVRYWYTGDESSTENVELVAEYWYTEGTGTIFTVGEGNLEAVLTAASDNENGTVIYKDENESERVLGPTEGIFTSMISNAVAAARKGGQEYSRYKDGSYASSFSPLPTSWVIKMGGAFNDTAFRKSYAELMQNLAEELRTVDEADSSGDPSSCVEYDGMEVYFYG